MAYKKHPRHVTQEQFADNTTVDGDRIDSAMESFERQTNKVPQGDIQTKWTPTMFVAGWLPQATTHTASEKIHHWPWLPSINTGDWVMPGSTIPTHFNNFERVKGYEIPGVNPTNPDKALASQYVWTTSFYVARPSVITSIDVLLHTDSPSRAPTRVYTNSFEYGTPPPQGYANGDASKDFSFSLHVDAPTSTENRMLNEIEVVRSQFTVKESTTSYAEWPAGFADMTPTGFPGGPPYGVWCPVDAEVPLHQDSRVRLSLVIPPAVITPAAIYNSSWDQTPWSKQSFTTVVHMLEEVV
tara:strand:- start:1387 stop:2280 length:894 start_codon:yes stop_codon:yes gene_type:complete